MTCTAYRTTAEVRPCPHDPQTGSADLDEHRERCVFDDDELRWVYVASIARDVCAGQCADADDSHRTSRADGGYREWTDRSHGAVPHRACPDCGGRGRVGGDLTYGGHRIGTFSKPCPSCSQPQPEAHP